MVGLVLVLGSGRRQDLRGIDDHPFDVIFLGFRLRGGRGGSVVEFDVLEGRGVGGWREEPANAGRRRHGCWKSWKVATDNVSANAVYAARGWSG